MNNGGQVCISVERVYVEEPVYDEFVQKVTDNIRQLRQGAPAGVGSVDIGAVTFPPQVEIIDEPRQATPSTRAPRCSPAAIPVSGPGRFYEPTVLVDVDHSMTCMQDETFGPTIPIMKISDPRGGRPAGQRFRVRAPGERLDEGRRRGEELARQIHAGVVCVNDAQVNYTALNLPMGGWKASGLGTRHGANGIRKYTKIQSLLVTRRALKREPFMFPYRAKPDDDAAPDVQRAVRARQARLVALSEPVAGLRRARCWASASP